MQPGSIGTIVVLGDENVGKTSLIVQVSEIHPFTGHAECRAQYVMGIIVVVVILLTSVAVS